MPYGEVSGGRHYETPSGIPNALVVHGELDDSVALEAIFAWARPQPQPVVVVPGADHFFTGRLPTLRSLVVAHLGA
jgi:alpha/beta superfamily hydrolase